MNWLKKSVLQDDLFCSTPFFRLNSLRAHVQIFNISIQDIPRCFSLLRSYMLQLLGHFVEDMLLPRKDLVAEHGTGRNFRGI